MVATHLRHPAQDLGIALNRLGAHTQGRVQPLHRECLLHMPHRHWHQGRLPRLAGQLDHAKRRGRKLGERRHAGGGHLQRKRAGVGQRTTALVAEPLGHDHGERAGLGQRRLKTHHVHRLPPVLFVPERHQRCAGGRLQTDLVSQLASDGCRERHRHRPQGQARALRPLTLATELGHEGTAHLVVEHLRPAGDDAGRAA